MFYFYAGKNATIMTHEHGSESNSTGLWYTYFGKGGAGVFAFLWILAAIAWIFSVLQWG